MPHERTVRSDSSARMKPPPPAIIWTPVTPLIRAGAARKPPVLPFPSWPNVLSPQALTLPSRISATPVPPDAAIAFTDVSPVTWTGLASQWQAEDGLAAGPSCLLVSYPQAQTLPSLISAML